MTVDTVNTDIFDDNKITGVLCVWFVGDKLERVRFDHRAIQPVKVSPEMGETPSPENSEEYKAVLDEMVGALNAPAEEAHPVSKAVIRKPKHAKVHKNGVVVGLPNVPPVGSSTSDL